ncbi:hypothetical protein F4802DRAFT_592554 [Xylaria palmicola]|nr:hypothetical protein F4802DRAFT_592554 [Xylaria palmicola]
MRTSRKAFACQPSHITAALNRNIFTCQGLLSRIHSTPSSKLAPLLKRAPAAAGLHLQHPLVNERLPTPHPGGKNTGDYHYHKQL